MCFYFAISGGLYVSAARRAAFSKTWAESREGLALQDEHKKALQDDDIKFSKDGYVRQGRG